MPAEEDEDGEEDQGMGEGASHVGAAEDHQAQGLVDDVGQH